MKRPRDFCESLGFFLHFFRQLAMLWGSHGRGGRWAACCGFLQEFIMQLRRARAPAVCALAGFLAISLVFLLPASARPPQRAADPKLASQLAAGEFGPALDAVSNLEEGAGKSAALRQIAGAQREADEFDAALATERRLPDPRERARAQAGTVRERGMRGGANLADFTELIDLITSTVAPESWDTIGGPGSTRPFNTGVFVDPSGVLRQQTKEEQTGALRALAHNARMADLNEDMARATGMRLVSLVRLERAVAARLEAGQPVPQTMRHLAGLTQVRHLFVLPEEGDLLIAGPAEGWRIDETGRPVGAQTDRPVLQLDDLVVVLRAFAEGGDENFGCSINTRDENLKQVKEFAESSQKSGPLKPGQVARWAGELQKRLGLQDVVVHGVPFDSRVAQVMVEADYRMKLIGVARLDGGPGIPSYFDLLKQARQTDGAPLEALRWWLTMKYAAILHDRQRLNFEIQGSSVLVQSENQFVTAMGRHVPTGLAEPLNRQFAQNFTNSYADLAKRDLVFAELRNVFDLALVAALLRAERLAERAGWALGSFAPGGAYQPAHVYVPRVVQSVMNYRVYGGKSVVVQVAGGVEAPVAAMAQERALAREDDQVSAAASKARRPQLPENRWWWDAAPK
jgi:hypothetical protein